MGRTEQVSKAEVNVGTSLEAPLWQPKANERTSLLSDAPRDIEQKPIIDLAQAQGPLAQLVKRRLEADKGHRLSMEKNRMRELLSSKIVGGKPFDPIGYRLEKDPSGGKPSRLVEDKSSQKTPSDDSDIF